MQEDRQARREDGKKEIELTLPLSAGIDGRREQPPLQHTLRSARKRGDTVHNELTVNHSGAR